MTTPKLVERNENSGELVTFKVRLSVGASKEPVVLDFPTFIDSSEAVAAIAKLAPDQFEQVVVQAVGAHYLAVRKQLDDALADNRKLRDCIDSMSGYGKRHGVRSRSALTKSGSALVLRVCSVTQVIKRTATSTKDGLAYLLSVEVESGAVNDLMRVVNGPMSLSTVPASTPITKS